MTDTAAFQATYSDWKVVRGRKVCQIVLEIPIERANEALAVLDGMPNPASECWVGVARLDLKGGGASEFDRQHDKQADTPPPVASGPQGAQRKRTPGEIAAYLCTHGGFNQFVHETYEGPITDMAKFVRAWCNVKSRADITDDNPHWRQLLADYEAWKRCLV